MSADVLTMKATVLQVLDELPAERLTEVLDFVLFLNTRRRENNVAVPTLNLPTVPAAHLMPLSGLIAWGGDAVADAERLYDNE